MEISEINPDGNVYQLKDATARTEIAQIKAQKVYSTEEVDTGKKWIDGKSIYRKVFTGVSVPQGGQANLPVPGATFAWFDFNKSFIQGSFGYRQPWGQITPYWNGSGITIPSSHPTGTMICVIEYLKD